MKKLLLIAVAIFTNQLFSQNISFSFVNARNTNDGTNDFYEADIYIASDTDFIVGSGQIYFNYNTAAFGENVHANSNFTMETPDGCILDIAFGSGIFAPVGYKDFIVNDNTTSRVSTSFQQSSSVFAFNSSGITSNITSTPTHLYSIKFKYVDVNESPDISFESADLFTNQFFTACGPSTGSDASDVPADCTNHPGTQITGDTFDSTGATLPTGITWNGSTSAFWANSSNWSGSAVPISTDDVTIPDVTNDPILNSGSVTINDLTVDASANLTIDTNATLQLDGDVTNNGLISINANASGSGVFITDNSSGQVTFQQDGLVANEWSIITAPVSGQSIKEFAENSANGIRVNTSVTPNRYAIAYYDASNTDAEWVYYTTDDLSTNTITFEEGRGYAISRATNGPISFTGTLTTNDINETVDENAWNAIGNPYSAYLPINQNSNVNFLASNATKLDDAYVAVYTWDSDQNKYVGVSQVDDEAQIAPGQGFFVKTKSGVSEISFSKSQRAAQLSGGVAEKTQSKSSNASIKLLAKSDNVTVDTKILFFNSATKGLDAGFDIGNFGGANFDVFTRLVEGNDQQNFTTQSLPIESYNNVTIPVGLVAKNNTEVEFSVETSQIPSSVSISLEDKETNTFYDITNTSFTLTIDELSDEVGRFYLHTSSSALNTNESDINLVNVFTSAEKELTITGLQSKATLNIYSIIGKRLQTHQLSKNEEIVDVRRLSAGLYIVNLQFDGKEISKKIVIE